MEHAFDLDLHMFPGEEYFGDVSFMANEQDDALFQSFAQCTYIDLISYGLKCFFSFVI